MIPRSEPTRFSRSRSVTRTGFKGKFTNIKQRTITKGWSLRTITRSTRWDRMRSEKFKRQFSSLAEKKPNKAISWSSKTNRRRSSRASKLNKRTAWRIRSWLSRSDWRSWRLKKTVNAVSNKYRDTTMTASTTRTSCVNRRKKKLCRWKSWRWSWSRSCRTLRLSRRMHTRSLSVHLKNLLPWWHRKGVNPTSKCDDQCCLRWSCMTEWVKYFRG